MWKAAKKLGEIVWSEVGLEVKFNTGQLSDGKSFCQNLKCDVFLLFGDDARDVDEGQHDMSCADAGSGVKKKMKELLSGLPLFGAAAKKREVHEPVCADGRDCDPMLLLQAVDFDDASIRGQTVSGST